MPEIYGGIVSLEDAARQLADEQRSKNAVSATAAEASQRRMTTPSREALEFVSFCDKHGVAPVPIVSGFRQNWRGKSVEIIGGRGWPLDVDFYDVRPRTGLCVLEDGTLVIVRGENPYRLGEPADPENLPYWVRPWLGPLADILAKAASNILIKKENGTLRPPY